MPGSKSSYLEDLRNSPGGLSGKWVPKDVVLEPLSGCTQSVSREKQASGAYVLYGVGCNSCGELGLNTKLPFITKPSYIPWPDILSGVGAAAAGSLCGPFVMWMPFRCALRFRDVFNLLSDYSSSMGLLK
jgi:hypothetical protein